MYFEFAVVLLIVLAAQSSTAFASPTLTAEPIGQSLSSSVGTVSSTQYPWYNCDPWNYLWCYQNYRGNWWSYPYYGGYYTWNYPYYPYYYATTVTQKANTFDLNVETNPAGIAPVNGKGTYNDGTAASFSVTSLVVPSNTNQRYVFSYWSGDFSGTSPSGTVTMDSAKSVVANYQLQNLLKISVDPVGVTSVSGQGWYLPTDSLTIGPVPSSISGGESARYVFQQWTIDSAPASGTSVEITMNTPHTVIAHYKTQYLLTVSSDYGIVQGQGWYDAGSPATFSVTTEVDTSYGVRQVFEKWTGDMQSTSASTTITMDSPHTVTAVWRSDSTILYATIALAICAAFVLGIGFTMLAVARLREPKRAPTPAPRPVAAVEPVSEKLKPAPTRKKSKPAPKASPSEPPPES